MHKQTRDSSLGTIFNIFSSIFIWLVITVFILFIISIVINKNYNYLIWIVWFLNIVFLILFFTYSVKVSKNNILKFNIIYGIIVLFILLLLFLKYIGKINHFTLNFLNLFSNTVGYIAIENKITNILNKSLNVNWSKLKNKFRLFNNWKHIIQNINKYALKRIDNIPTLNEEESNNNIKNFLLISNNENKLKNLLHTRDNINILCWTIIIIILLYYITNNE